eukprot:TRINITY_DN9460_c0_g1_i1.p1 TRINITY_DN9460_c0_g1~~TRINITY_DN9460_c0_g1_i1.p1  ORF type:complete len:117 (-),score=7.97 TRINITY_DN9460_c0_g1_i1:21-371(-)
MAPCNFYQCNTVVSDSVYEEFLTTEQIKRHQFFCTRHFIEGTKILFGVPDLDVKMHASIQRVVLLRSYAHVDICFVLNAVKTPTVRHHVTGQGNGGSKVILKLKMLRGFWQTRNRA